jgi:lysophospholipase L1-like esterase
MRRLSSAVVAATLIVSLLQVGISAAQAGDEEAVSYLALGDSLAASYQPNKGITKQGYVDDLWRRVEQQIPALSLRNVACPGETTRSLITGRRSLCHYAAGSQLNAAVAFLEAHPGQVEFITIDIGANDVVDRCMDNESHLFDRACVVDLVPRLQTRLARIIEALRTAAGSGVPILAMTYHDPFLGTWGLVPGGRAMARANHRAWGVLNAGLATAYADAGVTVADVAVTFRIDDFENTVVVPDRGELPVNVALACRWTWFCSMRFFGDPHPNNTGYRKIARTFYRELQGLLRCSDVPALQSGHGPRWR